MIFQGNTRLAVSKRRYVWVSCPGYLFEVQMFNPESKFNSTESIGHE
jgi:hypothetical protein